MADHLRANLLVIGAARSGTTALAHALGRRPEVFLTDPKENHFWAFTASPRAFSGPGDEVMFNRRLVADPQAYEALLAGSASARWRGDGSVSTLYHPDASVAAIRAHAAPEVRLVCLLREPAARAASAYTYLRGRGRETLPDLDAALAAEEDRIAAGYHHLWHYRAMSRYSEQLPAFLDAFGDRVFVETTEALRRDPAGVSARLCAFLDLPPLPVLDLDDELNRGGEPRSRAVALALGAARRNERLRRAVTSAVPARARERLQRANLAPPPPIDLAPLRRELRGEVSAVEELLGRALPEWRG